MVIMHVFWLISSVIEGVCCLDFKLPSDIHGTYDLDIDMISDAHGTYGLPKSKFCRRE